jgi:hypothetical protein
VVRCAGPGFRESLRWDMPFRRCLPTVAVALAAVSTVGCGAASHGASSSATVSGTRTTAAGVSVAQTSTAPAPICTEAARAAIAGFLRAPVASVSTRAATASSSYPICFFAVRAGGRAVKVSVEVDVEPQAYAVLERTIEEAAQPFPKRMAPAPIHVGGLGIDASWFPEEQHLLTTDAVRLVIATIIDLPRAKQARKLALAMAAARPYLGRSQLKKATPIGP